MLFSYLLRRSNVDFKMSFFRSKTREEKFIDYLVSDGILSSIPKLDEHFYRLTGECAGRTWSVKPGGKPLNGGIENVNNAEKIGSSCGASSQTVEPVEHDRSVQDVDLMSRRHQPGIDSDMTGYYNTTSDSLPIHNQVVIAPNQIIADGCCWSKPNSIFVPKATLPYSLLQETYRKWKSGMDLSMRFRRLRRLRASLVFQPLNDFPAFLTEFRFSTLHGSLGFFELLREFLRAFFLGVDVRLNETADTETWGVTSRISTITGQQQVKYFDHYVL